MSTGTHHFKILSAMLLVSTGVLGALLVAERMRAGGRTTSAKAFPSSQPETQASLEALTRHSDPEIRQKSLELLGVWQPQRAQALLPDLLLNEKNENVVLSALDLVARIKCTPSTGGVLSRISAKERTVSRKASVTAGFLANEMDQRTKEDAVAAIKNCVETELLMAPAGQPDPGIVLPYVDALAKLNCTSSVPLLLRLLRSGRSPAVRKCSAIALCGLARKDEEAALTSAWKTESDTQVRTAIEGILAKSPFELVPNHEQGTLVRR
ncbi:MAG TPA: hypothetical protein VGP72_31270 [Planctomycetota bacterium]|jgi:hypothetical protein